MKRFQLDYFDRQRQPLNLTGHVIPGYLEGDDMMQAQPLRFTYSADVATLGRIYREAVKAAEAQDGEGGICDTRRAAVLDIFNNRSDSVDPFGVLEDAQHPVAINCAWASLESVVRTVAGPDVLNGELEFMRKFVVNRYAGPFGTVEEKQAAGLTV